MRLVFLGPPGSGKGTQARKLAEEFKMEHISTGDILRNAVSKGTQTGFKAKELIEKGELVSDDVMLSLIKERLTQNNENFILDGFPRTVAQAQGLDAVLSELSLKLDKVVNFVLEDRILIDRLVARRICESCGREYNLKTKPPVNDEICDFCQQKIFRRADDTVEVINNRLSVYYAKTRPIEDYYRLRGLLVDIDGNRNFSEVFQSIAESIGVKE